VERALSPKRQRPFLISKELGSPVIDNRVTTPQNFMWWRARMMGGRTNHWGRVSLRMGEYDFKPRSRDGLGFDWPIGYDDVAPVLRSG
jgi:choline dehydrogenase-like flavoprotein